ncbi:DUF2956 family protein [Zobellella aerophila]|uniref:DUF2956 domain-containing protein n=1 Tax=Zobellella aerophila TaxID=870480 RepID=A0ABP6VNW2_9GAMM
MRYAKHKRSEASPETQEEAGRIARATQKPGQSKEQTRLIAQGIQKGIEEYKKQQKARARAADKARKQQARDNQDASLSESFAPEEVPEDTDSPYRAWLPWLLLLLSWLGFGLYFWLSKTP